MTAIEKQKAYWTQQLAGLPPPPQLPLSNERPPVSSFVRETVETRVEPEMWVWVRELALKSGATPQAALISAVYALLFRYTGQTDLSLGTVVEKAGDRGQGELVALRMNVEGTFTARQLIQRVGLCLKEASEQADSAFEIALEVTSRNEGIASSIFNTIINFAGPDRNATQSRLVEAVAASRSDEFALAALIVRGTEDHEEALRLVYDYDAELLEADTVKRLAGHVRMLLSSMAAEPDAPVSELAVLDAAELEQLLTRWNETTTDFPSGIRVHELFEAQVDRTPEAVAIVWRDKELTYRELNARANQLAAYLSKLDVGPNPLIGICLERSLDMVVGLLGILKAGGAYLPLDPSYPAERIAFMLQDARATVLLTQERLAQSLPPITDKVVRLDTDWPTIAAEDDRNLSRQGSSESLAYVLYTSGSTGKPKGVMVEHRNVVNFFTGMDQRINHEPGSTWLAVTSLSFDISVLELFWTLTRGFKVVLYRGEEGISSKQANRNATRPIDFSLFYFSSDQTNGSGGAYRLLIEGAKFADEHGFTAVWTPERHFHDFGGLYPNPSVTSAAVAMITKRLQIRSGSVVAPLHSPIRIAEEWAVVDNLSNGRTAISFASGWMPEDFVLKPENYASRKEIMFQDIDIVRKLWRGESVQMPGPLGKDVAIKILPRPVQRELPFWITAAGNPDTFEMAGKLGANLLTHLLGQSIGEVAEKVAVYRRAWREAGHRGRGRVALMLHTFVGDSVEAVKATVRQPLIEYLRKSTDLIKGYAWSFSAFKRQPSRSNSIDFGSLPKEEMDALLNHAFERYFETSGLFGTPETCLTMVETLRGGDIDEVACLIDFGINPDTVLEHLKQLEVVQKASSQPLQVEQFKQSIPELIERYEVTHLQCTPSMASMLLMDDQTKLAFGRLRALLVGGEALPATLAEQLRGILSGDLINMYGPTETTVWSSTYSISQPGSRVTIGRPIANTQIYIVDQNLRPVPVGLPGELMIGGAGVARGYLNRPELTAERFISNPFGNNGHNRIYRTGDLARYLPDGNIELLGRIDQQVKIRGHRIELGEIEATLNQHPMVRESVVVAKSGPAGDTRLVAYVIPREAQNPGASQLRSYVKNKLPEYMVPAHVVLMTAFPQTPNKKIDRKALPAPDASELNGEAKIEAPISEIEEALAELYAEVLQVTGVGRHDDFFALGGDSLSAVQLLSRIRQTCNVELPLESLFDSPTVAALAGNLEALFVAQASEREKAPTQPEVSKNGNSEHSDQPTPIRPQVFEPPRTATEEKLAKVWAEALGVEKVGRVDNFFALGGNSLIAIQLITRLESVFRVRLPLETLFNAPTIQQMAAFLATDSTLVTNNGEETALPMAPTSAAATEASFSILRRNDLSQYPLSSGQQRLWFLQQLEGGIHYNDHFNLRLTGGINVLALEQSIREILRRHEAMRASFTDIDGQPVQRILPGQNFTLSTIDLRSLPTESRLTEATRLAVEQARKPFDLAAGPLWRFQLLALADEDHILLITAHHIAIDGWSRGVFLNELSALYKAFLLGRPSPLPQVSIQYTDYAAWQSDWLRSDEFTRQLDYWKQRLAGTPPLLELPADRPRPPILSFRGARHFFRLSKSLTNELRSLARQEKVTFFMTLLAGFQSLLHRYTGQEDVLVGTPVANRPQTEVQGLIGYFLNTVVLRGDCSGTPTFRQLLKRVRATSLEAFRNQDLPLEKLIDALQLERNQSYSPLFQVFFVLQNVPTPNVSIPGLSVQPFEIDNGTAKFDLSVSMFEAEDGITGWLEYATDLFDAARMERLSKHYRSLLEAAIANPDLPMSQLPLLTPAERRLMLEEWNQTRVECPAGKCVHEIVEEHAARSPDQIAVEFGQRQMSYAELDRRATLLASHLQSLGVGPDSLVCVCLERSLELVIGVLGVLKAGGAYVPLDPAYPGERLAFILGDARAKVLLTETALLPALSDLKLETTIERPSIVCLDQLLANEPTGHRPIERRVRPENLAYVIYTSGSTGKPKGVQIEHRSVVNFLDSMRRKPGLTANDVLLAVTTLCFDIAGLELLLPLTSGARVLIASREETLDGVELARLLEQSGVTVMQATPATWRLLIEAGWKGNANFKILCGGEAWTQELAEALLARCGSLWNMYGPTETTIWSAVCEVRHDEPVLIGAPIANTEFYVLDKSLQPVPVGVPGELHIGGHGVARGYAGRPELTAERFISDPFASRSGARMYKTGDSVRYRADGKIEYLARMDHQVKVRGFRIELGEIESALAAYPGLRENVVIVREASAGEKQLVAYIVAAVEPAPATTELRHYLLTKLPDYMVPSAFVLLPALPRLPNGKIDRKELPAPDMTRGGKLLAAPVTALQKALAEAWKGLLRVRQVGLYDNFFDLGGHSLLAMQLIARVRTALKVEVTLQQFFSAPTLIEMSQAVEEALGRDESLKEPGSSQKRGVLGQADSPFLASALTRLEIDPATISRVFPVSLAQQRLWFLEQLEPNTVVYNLAYAFRLRGSVNLQAIKLSLQSIVDRHEALRTVFGWVGDDPVQVIQRSCPFELPFEDLSILPAGERDAAAQKLAETEARRPFNHSRDLMLRAKLLRLDEQEHLLLITMHHIVSDFWSVSVLFREFTTGYEKHLQGVDKDMPAPLVQYADFSLWQRDWLQGEILEKQLDYWKRQLAGAPPLLALPTDRPRPALQTYAGAAIQSHLSGELTGSLQELSKREGVTLFMTMLAAFKVLLKRYSQQDDIVVGSPIAGRSEAETEGLIGFFVNTIVLRTDLSGDPSFKSLLARVRDTALGAYAYQDLPFEKLVEEVQPERNLSYNPLCQVLFSFQNPAVPPLESAGVTLSLEPVSTGTSKTDLGLYITEHVDGIAIWAEYSTDLFDSAAISRLLEHYRTLLEAAVARPDVPVSRLPLLTKAERQQVLVDWNRTQIDYPKDRCLHELIEEQVERTPEAVAVVFEEARLTYRQLNERANQLAHHLQKLGVGPGVLVGICMERSLELVIGLLGILKAGGAYVPLDPGYPAERLGLVIEDARMGVLVTQGKCLEKLAKLPAHLLNLDRDQITIETEVKENLPKACRPEDLAYVIYTSGSTGRPKGVAIEHRSPVAFVAWAHTVFTAKELAGVLFSTSVCFDLSIFELFVPLAQGGRVILAENVLELTALGSSNEVTLVNTVPSVMAELVRTDRLPASVVTVNLAGEPLAASLVDKVYEQGSVQKVYDLYGPSETTTYSTFTLRSRGVGATIGRPIANTQIYLLDQQLQLVPIGVPGELHIGGVGLARGYLNRPELTAEKFIPDPFSSEPGARLYKTGDLARYLPDGTIEYLGRIDHQVKIRGFRIELGEIESVLAGHEAVREAVVVVREDGPAGKRLVAYVTAKDGLSVDVSELRNLVRSKLPDHMVPSAFVSLEKLPLTPNGKVDRKALPTDGGLKVYEGQSWAPPEDEAEQSIARVWAEVLGLESVGRESNFFDLGGHSLLLITARRRLEEIFSREVPVVEMFRHSTVRSLAKYLTSKEVAAAVSAAPPARVTVDKNVKQRRREVRQRLRNS